MRVICSIHPQYIGKLKPTTKCICCNKMWEMITHPRGYTSLFGYDDHSYMRIVSESKKSINCKHCTEPFTPLKREKICPECKLEKEIYREELYKSRK